MASAFTYNDYTGLQHASGQAPPGTFAIPNALSCLVLSWSEDRAAQLRLAARDESWQTHVCNEVHEFLRCVFQLDAPLTVIDLPTRDSPSYEEICGVVSRTHGVNQSLTVVCGTADDQEEEQWARQLGSWAYLPGVTDVHEMKFFFAEARKAVAKQSTAYFEAAGYR